MSEETPRDRPGRLTWAAVHKSEAEWSEWRRRFDARVARNRAARQAAIDVVKRNEELAARRRCWLF